jgi:hypothetical protein
MREKVMTWLSTPFFKYLEDADWSTGEAELCLAGFEPPDFADDRGPMEFVVDGVERGQEDLFDAYPRSIGRAQFMVRALLEAANDLARQINSYLTNELKDRLRDIEGRDLSDSVERKAALTEVAEITRVLDRLSKPVRRTFPQWKAVGT